MTVSFDSSILTSYYAARSGGSGSSSNLAGRKYAPTAPWSPSAKASPANTPDLMTEAVKQAMRGRKLIDEGAAKLDLPGASADYKKLFALFQGLNTLSGVANQISGKSLTPGDKDRIKAIFNAGLAEITSYTQALDLDKIRIRQGEVLDQAKSTLGTPKTLAAYVTPPLVSGNIGTEVVALQGVVKFDIKIRRAGTDHTIAIDLSGMGSTPRTLGNVVTFINDKLAADGVGTRVATLRIPGGDRTVLAGGKPVKVGTYPDSWAMSVKVDSGDTVTFEAADTSPAVYLAQNVGNPDPDGKPLTPDGVIRRQILKLQTEPGTFGDPLRPPGEANWVEGRVWARDIDKTAGNVRATQIGPDGSVYLLTDISGKTGGENIKGTQDVALQKYDSAGKLVYSRTLGAGTTASGLALTVSADGQVAIAGKVTGRLGGATDGPLNSGATGSFAADSDSFVTVFNAAGEEQWTQRRGARLNDEASHLAFGSDGSVYVAGRAQSMMPGTTVLGGWDGYVEGFKADATGKVQTLFTQSVGSVAADRPGGMIVDGTSIVLANNENGHAVLRRFDVSGATPVQTSSRDLGDLQGGDIAGLVMNGGKVVVAGSTRNSSLDTGNISAAHSGGIDGFVAQFDADLTVGPGNNVSYFGGSGDDKITGLAASGGRLFISGQAGAEIPGLPAVGKKDGFVARLDVATGVVDWSRRFTGTDGYASPTAIAVDETGASALDRLGLPKGTLHMTGSQQLTAVSSLRAGDQFEVRSGLSPINKTVTIETGDTLETLATKLRRALNFQAEVKIVTTEGVRRLQIKPINKRDTLEFIAGPEGKDALSGLGLPEGIVRTTITSRSGKIAPADGKGQIYGLKFDGKMTLDDASSISHVAAELSTAMGVIRQAYKDLREAATPEAVTRAAAAANGPVPAYLTNQISNYREALARLGGGS